MIHYLLDYVPLWVWLIITFVVSGVVYFYFAPIINMIWAVTPNWLKVVIGAVLALISAVLYGRHAGAKSEREIQKKRESEAVQTRSKINESVKNASDAELDKRADRWLRD